MHFPGGPVVKTSPSDAGGMRVWSMVGGLRSPIPCGQEQTWNRNNNLTNSGKTLKKVHIKKILKMWYIHDDRTTKYLTQDSDAVKLGGLSAMHSSQAEQSCFCIGVLY